MKILAVETSSTVAAAAIMDNNRLLGEYILNHKKTHSQKLMPMLESLMNDLELSPKDIDVYAASSGPGSFTGLRIGVTTVKSIAYAADKPVVSIPTLDALAFNIPLMDSLICPIMDARNNQVYTALYKCEKNSQVKITEYMGIPVQELMDIIKSKGQKTVFLGDAAPIHEEYIKQELKEMCQFAPGNLMLQKASSVAYLAYVKASGGQLENCFDMIPFYLRKSQAEREYEKKQMTRSIDNG
ncbi:MAG: tRNA (adenosine(37)-N6)-threonylcarbamoyltransferase complex dimerization subunit type 1 TsaB [Bacillota bacterium]|nr:tRNA (adenosine(37)-N6)-threonylcarbamoyltransferase complex dimerization subunit type 1 TsaB [Bacillota bacterium]